MQYTLYKSGFSALVKNLDEGFTADESIDVVLKIKAMGWVH